MLDAVSAELLEAAQGAGGMSTERTGCGTPRAADAGRAMTVYGWVDRRRDHGGLIFLDLRDHSGILQVVINPETAPRGARATRTGCASSTSCACTARCGRARPHNVNPRRDTGEVELYADECEVLSVARTPPFPVNEETEVEEGLRLRHRYLDLRRVAPAAQPAQPCALHRRAAQRAWATWASPRSRRR